MPVALLTAGDTKAIYNKPFEIGRDIVFLITISDENGDPVDITDYDFYGDVKREAKDASPTLGSFTYTKPDSAAGVVRFKLPRTVTRLLEGVESVVWDIFMVDTLDEARPIVGGKSKVIAATSEEPE